MYDATFESEQDRTIVVPPYSNRDEEKSIDSHHPSRNVHDLYLQDQEGSEIYSVFDPNFDPGNDILEEDSPYPEVRSAVANFDDPDMPASTLRAWVLGTTWAIILPGVNQFFFFRFPSIIIWGLVAQLIVFPLGRGWARFFPNVKILGLLLNPGPFTIKEHASVLVTIMAGVGAQSAYATDIVAVQRQYYNEEYSFIFQWMLVMSTQLIGFSIGGFTRRFLVSPPSMIWPNTLVQCALFNTLHSQSYAGVGGREGLSRERYFTYAFIGATVWYFVPGYLFTALRQVCWIAPENVKINQLFGYRSGLGFSILSFDWNQIAYLGSPLATPWWSEANVLAGFVFFYWFITPLLYYSNVWYSQYLPMSSSGAFDNMGKSYNLTRVISGGQLDMDAYKAYSPLYLSITFSLSYGLSFMGISATITHAIIHFRKPIMLHFRRSLAEQPDIHARLMSHYPQVPEWYYACIFGITFICACLCIELWPTGMTIWALLVALLVALFYVIPLGMIQAVTNRAIGLNVITELIIGFMIPGRPVAMMMFKTYGYITVTQAILFTADFKLGHYMKIPPRPMFWCQIVSTAIAGTVQLGVQSWVFSNIPDICTKDQKDDFTCSNTQVFATASIIWGAIGPGLQFAKGQVYYGIVLFFFTLGSFCVKPITGAVLMFFFIIGAACPVILWIITKRYPYTILNYVNFPLIFSGLSYIPPAGTVNYIPWSIVGFIFQFVIRRRHFSYWAKYNYVLSAALDAGTAVGVLLVFFCLQYPLDGAIGASTIQAWWGNNVYKRTLDWNMTSLRHLSPGQTFGPPP